MHHDPLVHEMDQHRLTDGSQDGNHSWEVVSIDGEATQHVVGDPDVFAVIFGHLGLGDGSTMKAPGGPDRPGTSHCGASGTSVSKGAWPRNRTRMSRRARSAAGSRTGRHPWKKSSNSTPWKWTPVVSSRLLVKTRAHLVALVHANRGTGPLAVEAERRDRRTASLSICYSNASIVRSKTLTPPSIRGVRGLRASFSTSCGTWTKAGFSWSAG